MQGTKATPLWLRVVPWGIAYALIGLVTAALSRHAGSGEMQQVWRLLAWALSLGVFAACFFDERSRASGAPATTALRAALSVALGGFVLAAAATVHTLSLGRARVGPQLVALVAWPVLLAIPAFLVALAAAAVLRGKRTA